MQNYKSTESEVVLAFTKILEDRPGGMTVAAANLTAGDTVKAGAIVRKDSNGLFHVMKTAELYANATNSATTYQVKKGHLFKVGEFIGIIGGVSKTITAIDSTTNTTHDVITVDATIGTALTAGDVLEQASSASATSARTGTPVGMVGTSLLITASDNHTSQLVLKGTAIAGNIPPATATLKALLPQITYAV
jgi:hypothetical protein